MCLQIGFPLYSRHFRWLGLYVVGYKLSVRKLVQVGPILLQHRHPSRQDIQTRGNRLRKIQHRIQN